MLLPLFNKTLYNAGTAPKTTSLSLNIEIVCYRPRSTRVAKLGQTAREQGGRSVWDKTRTRNYLTPCCHGRLIFQYMHFVTIFLLKSCVVTLWSTRVLFQTPIWDVQGYHEKSVPHVHNALSCGELPVRCWTLPSAYTGTTAPPYIVLQKASVQAIRCWLMVLYDQSGVMKHTLYGFIRPL